MAAHPGYTTTQLTANMSRSRGGLFGTAMEQVTDFGNSLFGQNVRIGVLPQLFAATAEQAEGGRYYGPRGLATARLTQCRWPSRPARGVPRSARACGT